MVVYKVQKTFLLILKHCYLFLAFTVVKFIIVDRFVRYTVTSHFATTLIRLTQVGRGVCKYYIGPIGQIGSVYCSRRWIAAAAVTAERFNGAILIMTMLLDSVADKTIVVFIIILTIS